MLTVELVASHSGATSYKPVARMLRLELDQRSLGDGDEGRNSAREHFPEVELAANAAH